ncbi:MAG: ABC transporter permease [Prevotella sp.]|nr:ABC transporter permease [Prevotella sp.]
MLGIAIGIAVMIVSVSVVMGFKHSIRDKVVGFGSHIVVSNYMTLQTSDDTQPINATDSVIRRMKSIEGVRHVGRYSLKQGVLKTDTDFLGVMLKGIGEDYDTDFLAQNIVEGVMPRLSGEKRTRQLLVSKQIAQKLKLKTGSKVYAYFLGEGDVKTRVFEVAGIYQTNLTKYDETFCFADLYTVSRLNGWTCSQEEKKMEVTGCELLVSDFDSIDVVEDRVIDRINKTLDSEGRTLSSLTIKEMNPQIFSWLELLDLNVWIILVLMVCVAGFTMISGLLIIIMERTSLIGLLKTLGARNSLIRSTFRWLALSVAVRGLVIGNVLGIGLCLVQQYTGVVRLDAETYYVSEVPVELNWMIILLLNAATLLLCTLALVLPSFCASMVKPAKTMRIE